MGGIAGIVDWSEPVSREAADAMAVILSSRGPDGAGSFDAPDARLRYRQRAVVPCHVQQPVVADDVVVLMDGWLYDHERIALAVGHDPTGQCDAHTLLAAWRRWGAELGRHLEGEYAAAVWDRRAKVLTLLRDRLGTRPLFWARVGSKLVFASEVPAVLASGEVPARLARDHVAEYLSFQSVHAPRTLLEGVYQVEPAHWLMADPTGHRTQPWWRPSYRPSSRPEAERIEALEAAVAQSVARRVPDGVEAGILLSGGLGSAAIASAAKARFLELPTFTVSFHDDPNPESPFAGRVANLLDLEHHEITVGTQQLAEDFVPTVRALGHPVGHPGAVLQLALARAARDRVRLVLSGDGGAELFGGRELGAVSRRLQAARVWSRLPRLARAPLSRLLRRGGKSPADALGVLALGIGGSHLFDTADRELLLADPTLVRPDVRQEVLEPWYRDLDADPLNTALHGAVRSTLQEGALVRADRTAAAAGLDVRFPLLDASVVDAAMALPGEAKLRRVGGALHTRWPLRAMLSGALPPALLNRPRRGLPLPMGAWLAGPGRLFMEARLRLLKENPWGLYRIEGLDRLKAEVTHSDPAGRRLWSLFLFDAWLRRTVGTHPGS